MGVLFYHYSISNLSLKKLFLLKTCGASSRIISDQYYQRAISVPPAGPILALSWPYPGPILALQAYKRPQKGQVGSNLATCW